MFTEQTLPPNAEELLDRYFFKEITEDEAGELLDMLQTHPSLRETVRRNSETDYLLRILNDPDSDMQIFVQSLRQDRHFGDALRMNMSFRPFQPYRTLSRILSPPTFSTRGKIGIATVLLTVLCIGVFSFLWMSKGKVTEIVDTFNPYAGMLAVVSETVDAQWNQQRPTFKTGEPIQRGNLTLDDGMLELLFTSGTKCIVEGPADLVFLGDNQLFCNRGHLSVKVPRQGIGFEVRTPHGDVRDLGTAFTLHVTPEQNEVHVVEGVVEVGRTGETKRRLTKGDAVDWSSDLRRTFVSIPMNLDRFVTSAEVKRRADMVRAVEKSKAEIRSSMEPLVRFDLQGDMATNVRLSSKNTTEGRTPERLAFPLANWSDAIRVSLPRSPESFTLDAWVRIDRLDPMGNSLLMSVGKSRGGVLWQLTADGAVQFGIRESARKITMYESPVVLTDDLLGRWVRLGVLVDASKGIITLYLNGSVIFSARTTHAVPISLREFDLGNWTPSTKNESRPIRNLDGAFDSFHMYDYIGAGVPAK